MKALITALLLEGCSFTPTNVVDIGEVVIAVQHADDTPAQHDAWVQERLRRLTAWCRENDQLSCEDARALKKEEGL